MEATMIKPKEELEARLKRAGIDPDDFADLLWSRLQSTIQGKIKEAVAKQAFTREAVFLSVINGLMVRWNGDSTTTVIQLADRLTDAIMRKHGGVKA
jgi:Na+/H+-dicarboxylate symporter